MKKWIAVSIFLLFLLTACGRMPQRTEENPQDLPSPAAQTKQDGNNVDSEGNEAESGESVRYEAIPDDYREVSDKPGELQRINYVSAGSGDKYAYIYVPHGYDAEDWDTQYEILYLMHGGGGSAETYFGSSENPTAFKNVIDNMIAFGDIQPMLIVAPSFYPAGGSNGSVSNAGKQVEQFSDELVNELMPTVEGVYHTYAENATPEGLKKARAHRAFGGFSMGSVTTWYVFADCLDYFKVFFPASGDCWALGQQSSADDGMPTAKYLAEAVKNNGFFAGDFRIIAATGTEDIAYTMLNNQIEAMAQINDVFLFSDTWGTGNLFYILADGMRHTYAAACDYVYDALKLQYRADKESTENGGGILEETEYRAKEILLQNHNQKIYGVAYVPDVERRVPLIICSHGLGGSYTNELAYAEEFASHGLAVYCFDFRGGGGRKSEGSTTQMSVMTEVSDLEVVLEAAKKWDFADSSKIVLLGDSQGGIVSAITAARHTEEIAGLILNFPAFLVSDAVRNYFPSKEDIEDTYYFEWIMVGRAYAEDMWDYDVYSEIGNYDRKVLLLHGNRDGIVDISYSEKAAAVYPDCDFHVINGGGHGFYGKSWDEALQLTWDYLKEIGICKTEG